MLGFVTGASVERRASLGSALERAHRTPSLSVVSAQCWQRLLAPRAAVSGHKRRELEGLTCRCSVNVFIFFFEVFFAISEEDGSCHFDHWLLPPQSFPVPPSMTPGPAAELSPSPLSTGGSWAQRERIQLLAPSWPPCAPGAPPVSAGPVVEAGRLHLLRRDLPDTGAKGHSYTSLRTLQPAHLPLPGGGGGRGVGWSQGEGAVAGHPF